jgi:hypothetical protein
MKQNESDANQFFAPAAAQQREQKALLTEGKTTKPVGVI